VAAYLVVFLVAALTTFVATPIVRRVAVRIGGIDQPSDRKVHPVPTPTMGGLAMYAGFLAALGISQVLPEFDDMNRGSPEPLAALVTCTLMVGLGVVDDLKGIRALTKLTGQIFAAGVLVLLNVFITYFFWPGSIVSVGGDLSVPLTILWVVAIANAVNLVDGLDGLAAGMVAIASGVLFVYMVQTPSFFGDVSQPALLAAVTTGICIGFLPWNFHPARIFMGDSGAMLLGMLLAIATISGILRNPYAPSGGDLALGFVPLLVPLLVLFVPFLDVFLAIVRRTRRGQHIGSADKEHLHHRLIDIGHSHRKAVLLMYLWSVLISASALAVGLIDGRVTVGLILAGALGLFLATALPLLARRRRNGNGADLSMNGSHRPGRSRRSIGEPGPDTPERTTRPI
jgi:UDP-GlcNAc:undecaprenyl-phosphate GlcNAc-1-phosphate transferase